MKFIHVSEIISNPVICKLMQPSLLMQVGSQENFSQTTHIDMAESHQLSNDIE